MLMLRFEIPKDCSHGSWSAVVPNVTIIELAVCGTVIEIGTPTLPSPTGDPQILIGFTAIVESYLSVQTYALAPFGPLFNCKYDVSPFHSSI